MELFIASVKLCIEKCSDDISFELIPSREYTSPIEGVLVDTTFNCTFKTQKSFHIPEGYYLVFSGKSTDPVLMAYDWGIYYNSEIYLISIEYFDDSQLKSIFAFFDLGRKCIDVILIPSVIGGIVIDPLVQPLGSLLLVYLANSASAFLIHASGVYDDGKGFVFTAVSGTGKSTMAGLWQKKGALVINDDRLWIQMIRGEWVMFNTPMVWYSQRPAKSLVSSVFLLKQSTINKVTELKGINSAMQVMSNCIQHFHSERMASKHLELVLDFTSQVSIFECAFKPDTSIVDCIRSII